MIIPHRALSPEALQGLLEEFVTRDGTDYGERETPLAVRVDQVRRHLESGRAVILFDEATGSSTIVPADQLPTGWQEGDGPGTASE